MKKTLSKLLTSLGISGTKEVKRIEQDNSHSQRINDIKFTDQQGNEISKEELSQATGRYNYAIYSIDKSSDKAKELHQKAREYGQKGDYTEAVSHLEEAIQDSPEWAYPYYDLAYTYLLNDDFENALKYYELTDKVAPNGFFTSKTAVDVLRKEKTGVFTEGLYKNYIALEWIDNPQEKAQMLKLLVDNFPSLAPAWKDYSNFLEGEERLQAIEKGLNENPDIETEGVLTINKALVLNLNGQFEEAKELLMQVIFNSKSTFGNQELAKLVLNSISEENKKK
ncbi:tetratricopeptide repeat protein [Tenacibaculum sp. ZS6-P6]|uniref:tetratricopeptide repeat protein n=1 Tax=Tenacibaculum sp. ZS6-P6 TaxID=3447503 RepID=UPI003F9C7560